MQKSYLRDALEMYRKGTSPGGAEANLVGRLLKRMDAQSSMLSGLTNPNQGFVKIERVASPEPVFLFGQAVPSYAHNRISVFFGEYDATGQRVPGRSVMSALISEECLAQLMLSQNRSNSRIALTAESYLGETLPPYMHNQKSPDDLLEEVLRTTQEFREELKDSVRKSRDAAIENPRKSTLIDLMEGLGRLVRAGEIEFRLGQHAENLQKEYVQHRVEAASAALNMTSILDAMKQAKLSPPETSSDIVDAGLARDRNALLNAAMHHFTAEEAGIAARALRLYLSQELADKHPNVDYDPEKPDPQGKRLSSAFPFGKVEGKPRLLAIADDIAYLENQHVLARRDSSNGYHLTASCAQIQGGGENLHSSFPGNDRGYFAIRFHIADVDQSFGQEKIQAGNTILEIGLSAEDMMTALRGHPTGDAICCSIDRIAGAPIPRREIESPIIDFKTMHRSDPEKSALLSEIENDLRGLDTLVSGGCRKVADRREMSDRVSQIIEKIDLLSEMEARILDVSAAHMKSYVQEMVQASYGQMNAYLEETHGGRITLANLDNPDI